MDDFKREQIELLERKLEVLTEDLRLHFEFVVNAVVILGKWAEWAKIHGYSEHAKGLMEETERITKR